MDCDGCGTPFSVEHVCRCNIGCLITLRHNLLTDEWGDLCAKALTPSALSNEPIIHTERQMKGVGSMRSAEESTEQVKQKCIARGEDLEEGVPRGGEQENINGTCGNNNRGDKVVVVF